VTQSIGSVDQEIIVRERLSAWQSRKVGQARAAVGVKLRQIDLFGPVRERVEIEQKVVKDTPVQKLYDDFVTILAGARGLVEINKRVRNIISAQLDNDERNVKHERVSEPDQCASAHCGLHASNGSQRP
jgi:hypothetical protein